MKLYEQDERIIKVYDLAPNYSLIKEFKRKEMETLPFDVRVLNASTNDKEVLVSKIAVKTISNDELNYSTRKFILHRKFHELSIHKGLIEKDDVSEYIRTVNYIQMTLNNYYEGIYDNDSLVKVNGTNEGFIHLLIAGNYVYQNEHSKVRSISNIIHLPESLYLLHLLLQERYDLLNSDDIKNQLQLFEFNQIPIREFNINDVNAYEELASEITFQIDNFKEAMLKKVTESSDILRLVRK